MPRLRTASLCCVPGGPGCHPPRRLPAAILPAGVPRASPPAARDGAEPAAVYAYSPADSPVARARGVAVRSARGRRLPRADRRGFTQAPDASPHDARGDRARAAGGHAPIRPRDRVSEACAGGWHRAWVVSLERECPRRGGAGRRAPAEEEIEHSLSVGRRVDAQADLPPRAELFSFSPTLAEPPVGDRFFAGTEPAFPRNIRRFVG
jgi:hypothetical protein